jgi:signal peptidase I
VGLEQMEFATQTKGYGQKIMLKYTQVVFERIVPWLFPSLIAFIVIIICKLFFFRLTYVQSSDMQQALKPGDLILLNKFSEPKRYDIIAFNNPIEDTMQRKAKTIFIQRCIGLPGDCIKIEDGVVYINNNPITETNKLQFNYRIKTKKLNLDSVLGFRLGIKEGGKISDEYDYSYSLTQAMADSLKKDTLVLEIEKKTEKKDAWDEQIYPHHKNYKWNKYNISSFYIPKKGDVINLDTANVQLYSKLITIDEDNALEIKHDSIFINNLWSKVYRVKTNYYFTMGDNRDNAIDSRYWGLLPENNVIGKLFSVIHSKQPKR